MIKPLRKRHFQIWTVMAVVLPGAIILAWLSIPTKKSQPLLQSSARTALPLLLEKGENENYLVTLRGSLDTSHFQLEWINKKILQYPTASIYEMAQDGISIDSSKLIGRIETAGEWHFLLDSTFTYRPDHVYRFLLYDFIHQQIIDTINLKR